jgi:hypothetical protein
MDATDKLEATDHQVLLGSCERFIYTLPTLTALALFMDFPPHKIGRFVEEGNSQRLPHYFIAYNILVDIYRQQRDGQFWCKLCGAYKEMELVSEFKWWMCNKNYKQLL